jgi:thiamine kinase-like enzyme
MIAAITAVLTVLQSLHDLKICHCDVRWPNIIFDVRTNEYILIDFEYAREPRSQCPSIKDAYISEWIKANNLWDETEDTWQVAEMVNQWMHLHKDFHEKEVVQRLNADKNWKPARLLKELRQVWARLDDSAAADTAIDSTAAAASDTNSM